MSPDIRNVDLRARVARASQRSLQEAYMKTDSKAVAITSKVLSVKKYSRKLRFATQTKH
jgi:hypothetical protein